jgi:hypothetical protein
MLDLPTMLNLVSTYKFLATEASSSVYVFYCGPFARRLLLGGLSSHEVFQAEQLLGEHLDLLDKVRIRYDYSTTIILSKMHLQNSVILVLVLIIVNNV